MAAPGAGALPAGNGPDRSSPAAREVAEAALRTAERHAQLHALADSARTELGRVFGKLYEHPESAAERFVAVARSGVGAESATERLERHPTIFGPLREEARRAYSEGWGHELRNAATWAARQWVQAEAARPAQPLAQVTAELQRAQATMRPFRELDRAKELAERALGLDRDRDRGRGRG